MHVHVIIDETGKVFAVTDSRSVAIGCIRNTWSRDHYMITVIYETHVETKFQIRNPPKIGENPNDTLLVTTLRIVQINVLEQPDRL